MIWTTEEEEWLVKNKGLVEKRAYLNLLLELRDLPKFYPNLNIDEYRMFFLLGYSMGDLDSFKIDIYKKDSAPDKVEVLFYLEHWGEFIFPIHQMEISGVYELVEDFSKGGNELKKVVTSVLKNRLLGGTKEYLADRLKCGLRVHKEYEIAFLENVPKMVNKVLNYCKDNNTYYSNNSSIWPL